MLFTLLEGLLIWLLVAFAGGCVLGSFLRACAEDQLEQAEPLPVTSARAAQMAHRV